MERLKEVKEERQTSRSYGSPERTTWSLDEGLAVWAMPLHMMEAELAMVEPPTFERPRQFNG